MGDYLKIYSRLTSQELRQLEYKRKYKKINPSWDDSLIILCKLFKPHLVSKMKVLDAGCGHGNYIIDEYRSRIHQAVGVDIDRQAVRKNVCLDKVVIANLEDLPFEDEYFDVVLSLWVLEHLENPLPVLSQLYRILKKRGVFIFVTPNKTNGLILLKRLLSTFPVLSRKLFNRLYGRKKEDVFGTFYRANSKSDLRILADRAGFKIERLFYNGDPSYLAFNDLFFRFAVLLDRLPLRTPWRLSKPHIIGLFSK
jgi:SAM-dependent methyltransferase